MNETMLEILRSKAQRIEENGVRLLKDFSDMHPMNEPGNYVIGLSPYGDQFWNELPSDGKQIQAKLLPKIDEFAELLRILTLNLPESIQEQLKSDLDIIRKAVEQDYATWWQTKNEAVEKFKELIKKVIIKIEEYYGMPSKDVLVIPDTNALITNQDIETWQFDDIEQFTIILTPTILSELDSHKIYHRNENVQKKAISLVNRFKEYRRRGSLIEGVTIVKNSMSIKSIAFEPNMLLTLPWLDSNNADDRFLATTLEIVRSNMNSQVFIVTSDFNMQNKAEMAGIPYREVPTPRAEQEEN